MMIDSLLTYLLSPNLPLSALVGGRVQPVPAPDDISDYPCIVFQSASYVEEYDDSGSVGLAKERIVFDCMATDTSTEGGFGVSRAIAFALRSALSGFGPAYLPDNTYVELITIVNIVGGWNDAARTIYKTSVHAMVQYQIQ